MGGIQGRLLQAAVGAVVTVLTACPIAIPSGDLPIVEQRWVVTALETTIGMDELINRSRLSSSVVAAASSSRESLSTAATDSCQFSNASAEITSRNDEVVVNVGPTTLACSLRDLCPGCSAGRHGKPALNIEREETFRLPDRSDLLVESVRVTGGTVEISLEHDLDFVPLKRGEFDVELWSAGNGTNDGEQLAKFSLDRDLVGGRPITVEHDFSRPVTIAGGIRVEVDIHSPADPDTVVDIDLSETIRVTTEVEDLTVSAASVRIDHEFKTEPQPVEVKGETVSEIVDRVRGDTTIVITLSNPFPIRVAGTIDLGEGTQLTDEERKVIVNQGTSDEPADTRKELTLTREELQTFLEQGEFSFTARVSTDGTVPLDTSQEIRIRIAVDVSLWTEPDGA